MDKVKCIIVDDEPLAQQVLERYVKQTDNLQLVKICGNALEAFEVISSEPIDLVFMDIKMPKVNGTDLVKRLKDPPAIIFTTAFSEYAAMSYELDAVDYLLKPITYEKFAKSISKFLKLHAPAQEVSDHSYFKVNGRLVKVEHKDIILAQSVKDYIIIRTPTEQYITHMTMKYLVSILPESRFKRVHRSYIINTDYITSIGKSEVDLKGVKIPLGQNYKFCL